MSVHHPQFSYTRLQPGEIRLLHPSFEGDKIVWSLKTALLHDEQHPTGLQYSALSYTWGDQSRTYPFICNSCELRIHGNLRDALPFLALRCSQFELPIWIDAICINQTDDAEKLTQIRLMHRIYRQALHVWVWLGCAVEHTQTAISLLPTISRVGEKLSELRAGEDFPNPESMALPEISFPIWPAIYHILLNEWYCRLWICQEAALAMNIIFLVGHHEITWDVLERTINPAYQLKWLRGANGTRLRMHELKGRDSVFFIRKIVQSREKLRDIDVTKRVIPTQLMAVMVVMLGHHHCYDPRDRVFGVFGFVGDDELPDVTLDNNISTADLYVGFCRYLFVTVEPAQKYWWIFLNKATFHNKQPGLPSWCPDLHHQNPEDHGIRIESILNFEHVDKPYTASIRNGIAQHGSSSKELILRGTILDTISRIYPEMPRYSDFNQNYLCYFYKVGSWEMSIATTVLGSTASTLPEELPESEENDHNSKINLNGYWRALSGDMLASREYSWTYKDFYKFRIDMQRWIALLKQNPLLMQRLVESNDYIELDKLPITNKECFDDIRKSIDLVFLAQLHTRLVERRHFSTSAGYFGLGHESLQDGDIVCVFNNARTPHILRRVPGAADADTYMLIGEAYVQGMMYGEIERLGLEDQIITLV